MATGDGLLVRLDRLPYGYSPGTLVAIARAALRCGNGIIDLSARGRLQIRGVTSETLGALTDMLTELDVVAPSQPSVEANALLGLDPAIDPDTAAISDAVTAFVATLQAGSLAPKLSVIVDGGGTLPLGDLIGDVRLVAEHRRWFVAIDGDATTATSLGAFSPADVVDETVRLICAILAIGSLARSRDLSLRAHSTDRPAVRPKADPIGRIALDNGSPIVGLGIPYGQIDAAALIATCDIAARHGATNVRLSPGRAMLFAGLRPDAVCDFQNDASAIGLATTGGDPRRRVSACVGRPACASGMLATRTIADLASAKLVPLLDASATLHLSGCAKGCAHPRAAALALVGTDKGIGIVSNGRADAPPNRLVGEADLPRLIARGQLFESAR